MKACTFSLKLVQPAQIMLTASKVPVKLVVCKSKHVAMRCDLLEPVAASRSMKQAPQHTVLAPYSACLHMHPK